MLRLVKECVGSLTSRLIYNTTVFPSRQPFHQYHYEQLFQFKNGRSKYLYIPPWFFSMKRFLPFIMLLMTAPAANAGALTHKISSSVQLTVDAAATNVTRLGNSYSISGTNVGTSDGTTAGMLSTGTISSGIYAPGAISANQLSATNGQAFSFSTAFTQGDVIPTSHLLLVLQQHSVILHLLLLVLLAILQVLLLLLVQLL